MTNDKLAAIADETMRRALIDSIGRLDDDQLKGLLNFITCKLAGCEPPEESLIGNIDENLSKQLVQQLTEDEILSVSFWILNLLSPETAKSNNYLLTVQKFVKYDVSIHLNFLGVKQPESIPQDLDENLGRIKQCLSTYRNALADLSQATYAVINTLDLIAESESVLQSGNWSTSKGGVSSVLALRLAVECRDRLRRSHQEFKKQQALPEEF